MGPAGAVLQEARSRQLGWEAFVLREVCEDKQPLIIGDFIRAAATHQLLTQSLSEGAALDTCRALHIELHPRGSPTVRVLSGQTALILAFQKFLS